MKAWPRRPIQSLCWYIRLDLALRLLQAVGRLLPYPMRATYQRALLEYLRTLRDETEQLERKRAKLEQLRKAALEGRTPVRRRGTLWLFLLLTMGCGNPTAEPAQTAHPMYPGRFVGIEVDVDIPTRPLHEGDLIALSVGDQHARVGWDLEFSGDLDPSTAAREFWQALAYEAALTHEAARAGGRYTLEITVRCEPQVP